MTNRRYVIDDADEFALLEDAGAIRQGISEMEAGLLFREGDSRLDRQPRLFQEPDGLSTLR
ncbi:MAG: hypothetical protein IT422_19470 [Pirellulaceae bacterium]|jgi:hypothetical protein|nr:hypothetical protein [Pirellulaceae bacterium]